MTAFDYVVLTIIGASVLISVMRGFVREFMALAGWVLAFVSASLFGGVVAGWLQTTISQEAIRALIAFVAVFVATLVVTSVLALAIGGLMTRAGMGVEDRLLGGFFGFARGMVIVMVLVILAGLTRLPKQPTWTEAVLSPPLEALAGAARPWLPQIVARNVSYD